ncbi:MAG: GTP-binding protein [Bacteroidota bacterium]
MAQTTDIQTKPTTILTGFLGAGKTTYLNYVLENNPDIRYAIIENEYGEQSIDSDLIIRAEDGIVELNNGCLCCTLNENLYDILNTLFDRRDEYDEIIVEATGVADPTGLAEPFIVHPAIKKQFPLSNIICMVDAELILDQLEETTEAMSQVTFSDTLLINKTDLVSEVYLQELKVTLQKLNPLAKIVFGKKGDYPPLEAAEQTALFDELHAKKSHGHKHDDHHHHHDHDHHHNGEGGFPVNKPHHHHHHHHTEEVVSHTFVFDRPFNYSMLCHQLFAYLTFQSRGLYRMKGLICLDDSDQQHVIQSVGKRLDVSEKRPWKYNEKRQSIIVFIGRKIKREGLERMLNRCIAKHSTAG